jgi:hypothetical protein
MLRVMGGDPVETMMRGGGGNVSQAVIEQERVRLGLDRPLYVPVRQVAGRDGDGRLRRVDVDRQARVAGDRVEARSCRSRSP